MEQNICILYERDDKTFLTFETWAWRRPAAHRRYVMCKSGEDSN